MQPLLQAQRSMAPFLLQAQRSMAPIQQALRVVQPVQEALRRAQQPLVQQAVCSTVQPVQEALRSMEPFLEVFRARAARRSAVRRALSAKAEACKDHARALAILRGVLRFLVELLAADTAGLLKVRERPLLEPPAVALVDSLNHQGSPPGEPRTQVSIFVQEAAA